MKLSRFVDFILLATLDALGSIVATDEVEGREVSPHGMSVGSIVAAQDAGRWLGAFGGVVGNDPALADAALAAARTVGAMYAAGRGSAADTDAAARLVWRLVVGGEAPEWELRSSSASWVLAPAGVALWDGTTGGGEPRVWVATWREVLAHLGAGSADTFWTDEEDGDDDNE